jgi:hypothetical protein
LKRDLALEPLQGSAAVACRTILENLRSNRKSADPSTILPSNCSATDQHLIIPVGDEVAPFSVARHIGIPVTNAVVTRRAFG